jgi:hypothetical protein
MMDMMALKYTGIDPLYWKVMWFALNDDQYDMKHFLDSLSPNQMGCKYWLAETLSFFIDKDDLRIQLFGGWFGFPISDILHEYFNIRYIHNIDLDPKAIKIYRMMARERTLQKYEHTTGNVSEPHNLDKDIDVVINTSSEHMHSLPVIIKNKIYKKNCLFVLQSNNMFHIPDHSNCVNSEQELADKSQLNDIKYQGSYKMPNGYERYMVIGKF